MNDEIMVSVCMITYNHADYIQHALESVLMQKTTFPYEIIIGDDCSTDETVLIIQKIQKENPDRIQLIAREKNIGICPNSYDVRCHAKGKYIAALEGDDYWIDPYKLQKQVNFLQRHPECSAIAGCMGVVNEREHPIGRIIPDIFPLNCYFEKKDAMRYKTELLHPGSLMYKNFIKNNKEKYQFLGHHHKNFGGHQITIFLLADLGKIYISDEIYGAYRLVKRTRASNANSFAAQTNSAWRTAKIDSFLYMQKYFKNSYDLSTCIVEEFINLRKELHTYNISEKKKILWKYFKKVTFREKIKILFYMFKEQYV